MLKAPQPNTAGPNPKRPGRLARGFPIALAVVGLSFNAYVFNLSGTRVALGRLLHVDGESAGPRLGNHWAPSLAPSLAAVVIVSTLLVCAGWLVIQGRRKIPPAKPEPARLETETAARFKPGRSIPQVRSVSKRVS